MPRYADPLAARDVEGLAEWIRMGAPWPESAAATVSADLARPVTPRREVTADERAFWSFRASRSRRSGAEEKGLVPLGSGIPNHEPSLLMMNTGHIQPGRPALGAWLTYGLGVENRDLPGFVVLCPDQPTVVGPPLWSNAFLPAVHQGTYIPTRCPASRATSTRRS